MPEITATTEDHVMDFVNNIGPLSQAAAIQSDAVALFTAAKSNPDLQESFSQGQMWLTAEAQKLESDLGQPLFQRQGQSLSPGEILLGALYMHAAANLDASKQAVDSWVTGRSSPRDLNSLITSIEPDFSLGLLQETSRRANGSPAFAKQLKVASANAMMIGRNIRALQDNGVASIAPTQNPDAEAVEDLIAIGTFLLFLSLISK